MLLIIFLLLVVFVLFYILLIRTVLDVCVNMSGLKEAKLGRVRMESLDRYTDWAGKQPMTPYADQDS